MVFDYVVEGFLHPGSTPEVQLAVALGVEEESVSGGFGVVE